MNLLMLLLAMLTATAGAVCTVDDVKNQIGTEHEQVADYIAANVPLFAQKYREGTSDESFVPTEVEFRCPVYLLESEKYATYLDFDGENGYLLLADDYELLDFSTSGQLEWFASDCEVVYSRTEGYCRIDEEGNVISLAREKIAQQEGLSFDQEDPNYIEDAEELTANLGQTYGGQLSNGSIYEPDIYMRSRFGSDFKLKKAVGNTSATYKGQADFSVYAFRRGFNEYTEGNCVISACYLLLKEMMDKGKYKLTNSTVRIEPKNDKFYTNVIEHPSRYGYDRAWVNTTYLPLLYSQLRDYFIAHQSYTVEGAGRYCADNAINYVAGLYKVSPKAAVTSFYSFDSCVKNELDKGRPTIYFQTFGGYYAQHAMLVTGYRTYEKVSKWWIFKIVETRQLMMINDNWSAMPRYIDYNQMAGSLDGLLSSFLRVK